MLHLYIIQMVRYELGGCDWLKKKYIVLILQYILNYYIFTLCAGCINIGKLYLYYDYIVNQSIIIFTALNYFVLQTQSALNVCHIQSESITYEHNAIF